MIESEQVLFHYPPYIMNVQSRNYEQSNGIDTIANQPLNATIVARKALGQNLTLGNEQIKHAPESQVQETMDVLQSICEKTFVYNTHLPQGQLTKAIFQALKNNYIKLTALTSSKEPIPQSMIDLTKMFIQEYQIQQKTYSNLKHSEEEVQWPDTKIMSLNQHYATAA